MKPTKPTVPADLLRRCLSTIPATATTKPDAPRLFVGDGSRKRLAWLSVAAAVPVVTVLAVLPVRKWVAARSMPQHVDDVATTDETINYVRQERWYTVAQPNPKRTKAGWDIISPKIYSVTVLSKEKGYVTIDTKPDYRTPSNLYTSRRLLLPDGSLYRRFGNNIIITKDKWAQWPYGFKSFLSQLSFQHKPRIDKRLPISIVSQKKYMGKWKGNPAEVYDYIYERKWRFSIEYPESTVRAQYFVSPETGLLVGQREYERHPKIKTEYLTKESNIVYTPPYDDSAFFDVKQIMRGAKVRNDLPRR